MQKFEFLDLLIFRLNKPVVVLILTLAILVGMLPKRINPMRRHHMVVCFKG